MKIPEVIKWVPTDQKPDSETTVLLFDPRGNDPIWLGYWDGELWWFIDGHRAAPTHWADMPGGPK